MFFFDLPKPVLNRESGFGYYRRDGTIISTDQNPKGSRSKTTIVPRSSDQLQEGKISDPTPGSRPLIGEQGLMEYHMVWRVTRMPLPKNEMPKGATAAILESANCRKGQ